jgi:hypothetical protein
MTLKPPPKRPRVTFADKDHDEVTGNNSPTPAAEGEEVA